MATINPTVTVHGKVMIVKWLAITENDTPAAIVVAGHGDRSVQVLGTFGGTSIAFAGSLDGTNFVTLRDFAANSLTFTSADLRAVNEMAYSYKPVRTGGSSTSVEVWAIFVEK